MDGELFFQALRDVDDGALLKQLDGKLCELVSACNATGGSGKVSLVLEVKKCPKERMVKVKPKVTASVPSDAPGERVLYADKEGRLCTDEPARAAPLCPCLCVRGLGQRYAGGCVVFAHEDEA